MTAIHTEQCGSSDLAVFLQLLTVTELEQSML